MSILIKFKEDFRFVRCQSVAYFGHCFYLKKSESSIVFEFVYDLFRCQFGKVSFRVCLFKSLHVYLGI